MKTKVFKFIVAIGEKIDPLYLFDLNTDDEKMKFQEKLKKEKKLFFRLRIVGGILVTFSLILLGVLFREFLLDEVKMIGWMKLHKELTFLIMFILSFAPILVSHSTSRLRYMKYLLSSL